MRSLGDTRRAHVAWEIYTSDNSSYEREDTDNDERSRSVEGRTKWRWIKSETKAAGTEGNRFI